MVRLGLIGIGESWETRELPALLRLGDRVEVTAVYDPVAARGRVVAAELEATHVDGVLATARRHDVDALLVADPGPAGLATIRLASWTGKPTLVAGTSVEDGEQLAALANAVRDAGAILMPGLVLRYAPATARLRELSATALGRPREIELRDPSLRRCGRLAELADWCGYVGQLAPRSVRSEPINGRVREDLHGCRIRLEFEPAPGRSMVATIEPCDEPGGSRSRVVCEHGTAEILLPDTIAWRRGGEEPRTEQLAEERPDFDVMLDQFLRRVVGGLVPIPDFGDFCRGLRVGVAAVESLRERRSVDVV